jgi:hypothetical protein
VYHHYMLTMGVSTLKRSRSLRSAALIGNQPVTLRHHMQKEGS